MPGNAAICTGDRYIGNHGRLARRPLVRRMERMDPQTTRKENIASSLRWRGCAILGVGANYAAAVRAKPCSSHMLASAGGVGCYFTGQYAAP
jgi:hypothetical protein